MNWLVTYRGRDGTLREECIKAADRAGCMAECRRMGIAPTGIREGKDRDKARPSRGGGSKGGKHTTARWVAAVLIAAAIGGGAWWWMGRGGRDEARPSQMEKPGKPKAEKPKAEKPKERPKEVAEGREGARTSLDRHVGGNAPAQSAVTNEVTGVKTNKKFRIVRKDEGKKKLFHNIADIYISRVVNSTPGNLVVGTVNYDRFEAQFKKALEQPITIDADDTPEEAAKKQAVIDTRAELKKMLDRGEDIAQVMREAEAEGRRLWAYKRSLQLELAKAMKDGKFKADDMQDYVNAANLMLKENGMAPLKYPQFWVNRMRQQEAEAAGAAGK